MRTYYFFKKPHHICRWWVEHLSMLSIMSIVVKFLLPLDFLFIIFTHLLESNRKNNHELLITFLGESISYYYYINKVTHNSQAYYLLPATHEYWICINVSITSAIKRFIQWILFNKESEPSLNAFKRFIQRARERECVRSCVRTYVKGCVCVSMPISLCICVILELCACLSIGICLAASMWAALGNTDVIRGILEATLWLDAN